MSLDDLRRTVSSLRRALSERIVAEIDRVIRAREVIVYREGHLILFGDRGRSRIEVSSALRVCHWATVFDHEDVSLETVFVGGPLSDVHWALVRAFSYSLVQHRLRTATAALAAVRAIPVPEPPEFRLLLPVGSLAEPKPGGALAVAGQGPIDEDRCSCGLRACLDPGHARRRAS